MLIKEQPGFKIGKWPPCLNVLEQDICLPAQRMLFYALTWPEWGQAKRKFLSLDWPSSKCVLYVISSTHSIPSCLSILEEDACASTCLMGAITWSQTNQVQTRIFNFTLKSPKIRYPGGILSTFSIHEYSKRTFMGTSLKRVVGFSPLYYVYIRIYHLLL